MYICVDNNAIIKGCELTRTKRLLINIIYCLVLVSIYVCVCLCVCVLSLELLQFFAGRHAQALGVCVMAGFTEIAGFPRNTVSVVAFPLTRVSEAHWNIEKNCYLY